MHTFYNMLHAVLEKEENSKIVQEENTIYEKIPLMLSDTNETTSGQVKKWSRMLCKIRDYLFAKQVGYIVTSCFIISMEYTPEISKFVLIKKMFQNRMMDDTIHEYIISLFQKSQRCYYAFSKLARIFRLKHTPVQITTDLYMSDLCVSHKNTFVLFDTNRIYYFSLKDLSRIITESLTFSYSFFSEPTVCKNPYNNIPFSKSALYNMYFQMKSTFCIVPAFIQLFFESDFDIYKFKKRNEWYIREYKIQEYIFKTDPKILLPDIIRMFRKYDTARQLTVDPDIPPAKLFNSVKQLYKIYLCRKYCYCSIRSEYYENELVYKMGEFIRLNPTFGRKTRSATPRYSMFPQSDTFQFNTKTVDVVRETPAQFMETHRYSDVLYNRYIQYGIITEPTIHTEPEPEPNTTTEYVSSLVDNAEETRHVDTDSDEGETATPIFEEDESYSESDTEND